MHTNSLEPGEVASHRAAAILLLKVSQPMTFSSDVAAADMCSSLRAGLYKSRTVAPAEVHVSG